MTEASMAVVGVTGLKTVESPQPGFAIARGLKEGGFSVVGIDDSPLTAAVTSRSFDAVYCSNDLRAENFSRFLGFLHNVRSRTGMSVIIPGYDRDVYFFVENARALSEAGFKLALPSVEALRAISKPSVHLLRKFGFPTPKSAIVSSERELVKVLRCFSFPVVCKGLVKDAYIAHSKHQAVAYFHLLREIWGGGGGPILVQQFIFGHPLCVAGVADGSSDIVGAVAMRKLGIDAKGTTWCGYTLDQKNALSLTRKLVARTGWVGGFEVEFLEEKSGRLVLFEINPRLPSWIHLATASGQNFPVLLANVSLGLPVRKRTAYRKNLAFVREPIETTCSLRSLEALAATQLDS